jgi:hypothetical protein
MGRCMVEANAARNAILVLHISKSGGTSACETARMERCSIGDSEGGFGIPGDDGGGVFTNCNDPRLDDGPHWLATSADASYHTNLDNFPSKRRDLGVATCAQRRDWADAHHMNYMQIENFYSSEMVAEASCAAYFVNVVYVRDPLDRLFSHYREILTNSGGPSLIPRYDANLKQTGIGWGPDWSDERLYLDPSSTPRAYNVSYLSRLMSILSDNYNVRSLAGEDVFSLPFGAIGESQYAVALEALRNFDWVIPLGAPATDRVLHVGLGWAHGMDDLSRDQKRPARGGADAFLPFSASDVAQLSELNRFDLRLGGEVSRLHALDVASIEQLQRYYPAAVAPGPASDSCCGRTCLAAGAA